jgi:hypothetical protein
MAKLEDFGIERDPVIEVYKKDVDVTLLQENLKLTMGQRLEKMAAFCADIESIRGAARGAKRTYEGSSENTAALPGRRG